jgi:simple sugar transport system permease protein
MEKDISTKKTVPIQIRGYLYRAGYSLLRRPVFGVLIAFIVIFTVFSIIAPEFLTVRSITGIFTLVAELGIIAIGETFLIISGEFDLSAGSVYALAGALFVVISNRTHSLLGLPVSIVAAAGIGLINGLVTMKTKIPSFIATLGMMMMTRGALLVATGGHSLQYQGDPVVHILLTKILKYGFRPSHLWYILLILIFSFILFRTRYGNWVFATGGNKEAARAQGINPDRVKLKNFITCSALAGFSGCIAISRFKFSNVGFGTGYELEAIASSVIGGTFIFGGYGTIIGAGLGTFIVGMIRSGLVLAQVPGYFYRFFVGAVLIIAAIINNRIREMWS